MLITTHTSNTFKLLISEIANSSLQLLHISLVNKLNLVLDQENKFFLISLDILITCFLDNIRILLERLHVNHFLE